MAADGRTHGRPTTNDAQDADHLARRAAISMHAMLQHTDFKNRHKPGDIKKFGSLSR